VASARSADKRGSARPASAAAAATAPGAGIGLFVCRQLVEAMGGRIAAESAPGVGTTFTLRLPAWPPPG